MVWYGISAFPKQLLVGRGQLHFYIVPQLLGFGAALKMSQAAARGGYLWFSFQLSPPSTAPTPPAPPVNAFALLRAGATNAFALQLLAPASAHLFAGGPAGGLPEAQTTRNKQDGCLPVI